MNVKEVSYNVAITASKSYQSCRVEQGFTLEGVGDAKEVDEYKTELKKSLTQEAIRLLDHLIEAKSKPVEITDDLFVSEFEVKNEK